MEQQRAPLFWLPAELRNSIYALALTSSDPITDPTFDSETPAQHRNVEIVGAALLSTCKRICSEAEAILYTENTFRFTNPILASRFLQKLCERSRKHIKHLVAEVRSSFQQDWLLYLAKAGMLSVHTTANSPSYDVTDRILLMDDLPWFEELTLDVVACQRAETKPGGFTHLIGWLLRAITMREDYSDWKPEVYVRCLMTAEQKAKVDDQEFVPIKTERQIRLVCEFGEQNRNAALSTIERETPLEILTIDMGKDYDEPVRPKP